MIEGEKEEDNIKFKNKKSLNFPLYPIFEDEII
jgi:hypothetical protein